MSDVASQLFEREAIRELIARVGRLLDTKDFAAVIASFAEPGSYVLRAYSPEIGKEMIWMSVKRAELLRLLKESAEHVHDLADRTHQITVDQISLEKGEALARSTFSVLMPTAPARLPRIFSPLGSPPARSAATLTSSVQRPPMNLNSEITNRSRLFTGRGEGRRVWS